MELWGGFVGTAIPKPKAKNMSKINVIGYIILLFIYIPIPTLLIFLVPSLWESAKVSTSSPDKTPKTSKPRVSWSFTVWVLELMKESPPKPYCYSRARARASWSTDMRLKTKCGAKTRTGRPCVAKAMVNGRCRNHGGMSTGPRTAEGKARSLAALARGRGNVC